MEIYLIIYLIVQFLDFNVIDRGDLPRVIARFQCIQQRQPNLKQIEVYLN